MVSLVGKSRYKLLVVLFSLCVVWMLLNIQVLNPVTRTPPPDITALDDGDDIDESENKLNAILALFDSKKGQILWSVLTKLDALLNSSQPSFSLHIEVSKNKRSDLMVHTFEASKREQEDEQIAQRVGGWRGANITRPKRYPSVFLPALSESERAILFDLAVKLSVMCHLLNITYFMYGGTLLGSYRHHDLIPWDDDIDLIVEGSQREKLYSNLISLPHDYHVIVAGNRFKFFSTHSKRTTMYPWNWPYLDISFYFENDTHIWDSGGEFRRYIYHKNIIFPLHDRPLGNIYLKAPRDSFAYIKSTYKNPNCETHFYSHRYELSYRHKQITVQCSELKETVPFVHRDLSPDGIKETLKLGTKIIHSIVVTEPKYAIPKPYVMELA